MESGSNTPRFWPPLARVGAQDSCAPCPHNHPISPRLSAPGSFSCVGAAWRLPRPGRGGGPLFCLCSGRSSDRFLGISSSWTVRSSPRRHPDRSGPIFSCAPNYGASGGGVEGSLFRQGMTSQAAEKLVKVFLQGLKPIGFRTFMPGLKPRPPKEKTFSASCSVVPQTAPLDQNLPKLLLLPVISTGPQ